MKENLSDLFKDFKERLSSPFFSSFIIAWLIINWKIPVALFFYKQEELKVDNFKSYIDLIQRDINNLNGWILPTVSALLYCFVFPFIRNWIVAAQAYYKASGSRMELKYSSDGKVSISKYISLRKNLTDRTEMLEAELKNETNSQKEYEQLKTDKLAAQQQVHTLNSQLNLWLRNSSLINGMWNFSIPNDTSIRKIVITINGSVVFLGKAIPENQYILEHFYHNPNSRDTSFCFCNLVDRSKTLFYNVKINEDLTKMEGLENNYAKIIFEKVSEQPPSLLAT